MDGSEERVRDDQRSRMIVGHGWPDLTTFHVVCKRRSLRSVIMFMDGHLHGRRGAAKAMEGDSGILCLQPVTLPFFISHTLILCNHLRPQQQDHCRRLQAQQCDDGGGEGSVDHIDQ